MMYLINQIEFVKVLETILKPKLWFKQTNMFNCVLVMSFSILAYMGHLCGLKVAIYRQNWDIPNHDGD